MKFETNASSWREVLAREVAFQRKRNSLSTREAEKQSGVPHSTISKVEKMLHVPQMRTVEALVSWLGMEIQIVRKRDGE